MIGRLSGRVSSIDDDTAILDVGGVGYEVHAHARLLARLAVGEAASLAIETVVREDMIRLYGFGGEAERRAFRLLQGVQGVGARHALAVLAVMTVDDLHDAAAVGDTDAFARAHGVGRKLAQRLAAELGAKLGALLPAGAPMGAPSDRRAAPQPAAGEGDAAEDPRRLAQADAAAALVGLGYDGIEARRAVAEAARDGDGDAAALVKVALRTLAGGR